MYCVYQVLSHTEDVRLIDMRVRNGSPYILTVTLDGSTRLWQAIGNWSFYGWSISNESIASDTEQYKVTAVLGSLVSHAGFVGSSDETELASAIPTLVLGLNEHHIYIDVPILLFSPSLLCVCSPGHRYMESLRTQSIYGLSTGALAPMFRAPK